MTITYNPQDFFLGYLQIKRIESEYFIKISFYEDLTQSLLQWNI